MELIQNIVTNNHGIVLLYLLGINVVTFLAFGIDKAKAKMSAWRIKEATLLGLSLIGGSLGGFLGMGIFHHKVRKPKFYIGVPVMLVIHVMILIPYLL